VIYEVHSISLCHPAVHFPRPPEAAALSALNFGVVGLFDGRVDEVASVKVDGLKATSPRALKETPAEVEDEEDGQLD